MDKTKIGVRTTHGRTFFRYGVEVQPKGVTTLELDAAQRRALEAECAAPGSILEIVQPAAEQPAPVSEPASAPAGDPPAPEPEKPAKAAKSK